MRILHVLDHGLPLHSGYTFRTRAIVAAQMRRGHQVAAITGPRQQALDVPFETVDGIDFFRTAPINSLPPPLGEMRDLAQLAQGRRQAVDRRGANDGAPHHRLDVPFETVDGIDFFRTAPINSLPPPLGELREIAHFAARIDEVVAEFRPDVLHAHSPVLDALAALRVGRRRDLPVVYEIRAFWEDAAVGNNTGREGSARYRLTKALETWTAKRVDAVAVICAGLRDDLIARGVDPERITISPNGVDLTLFGAPPAPDAAIAAELGLAGADVIGFIGSFYDYEGLDTLIAAMPALIARRPKLHLMLVGGGPVEEALRAQAAASSAAHAIHFVGRVAHALVERYYSLIDVLVYPRRRMRLTDLVTPLKPLEAMAQDKLVAASDVGGHRELIRDGDAGTLFAADNPDALAAKVAGLFDDRSGWDAMRARGRAFVERERNWAINVARYDAVYHKLTAAAARKPAWPRSSKSPA